MVHYFFVAVSVLLTLIMSTISIVFFVGAAQGGGAFITFLAGLFLVYAAQGAVLTYAHHSLLEVV